MLVLTRKPGESILIGSGIRIRVISSSGASARIAIEAPEDVTILREEVYERIARANRDAAAAPVAAGDPAARGTAAPPVGRAGEE